MKISIVTVSYNKVQFIERTIKSVIEQNYSDIEYIVIDGNSSDGSIDIINKYRENIYYFVSEPDNGPADALNKGFCIATGDIYGFINADDTYLPEAFSNVVKYFNKHPKVDCILGDGYKIDENDTILRKIYSDSYNLRQYLAGSLTVFQPSIFFRKSAFNMINGFNDNNKISWDGELLVDFAINKIKIKSVSFKLGNIRIYDDTITSSKTFRMKYENEKKRIYSKIYKKQLLVAKQRLLFNYYRYSKIFKSPAKITSFLKHKVISSK